MQMSVKQKLWFIINVTETLSGTAPTNTQQQATAMQRVTFKTNVFLDFDVMACLLQIFFFPIFKKKKTLHKLSVTLFIAVKLNQLIIDKIDNKVKPFNWGEIISPFYTRL